MPDPRARPACAARLRNRFGTAGFSGFPVSTTHIISAGVAGAMAESGAAVQRGVIQQSILAWVLTLPATIFLAGLLFWLLA